MMDRHIADPLRRILLLSLAMLSLGGLMGCSLPGTAAPTATPPATATLVAAVPTTVVPSAMPSAAPPSPTSVPPTATAAPTATATAPPATPATPTTRPGTPGTPATPIATPVASGQTIQDERGECELALPAGFVAAGAPGRFASADGRVLVALQSLNAGPDETLDDLALPFVGAFIPTVAGYEQTAVIRLAESLRIDFRGGLPQPGNGTLYFGQFGATVCAVTFFVADGAGIDAETMFTALIATLRPKGVG